MHLPIKPRSTNMKLLNPSPNTAPSQPATPLSAKRKPGSALRGLAARWLVGLVGAGLLSACSGIPISSVPKLLSLQSQLIELDPGQFMVAIAVDARMSPPADAVPVMHLAIKPQEEGAFTPVERKLPMQWSGIAPVSLGLAPAAPGRRWLVYSFTPESAALLRQTQASFKSIQAQRQGKSGGSVSLGIAQDGVAVRSPQFADTRWESWLQTSQSQGFYQLWSGTVAGLLKAAQDDKDRAGVAKALK